jgi:hypothetical protein
VPSFDGAQDSAGANLNLRHQRSSFGFAQDGVCGFIFDRALYFCGLIFDV